MGVTSWFHEDDEFFESTNDEIKHYCVVDVSLNI